MCVRVCVFLCASVCMCVGVSVCVCVPGFLAVQNLVDLSTLYLDSQGSKGIRQWPIKNDVHPQ